MRKDSRNLFLATSSLVLASAALVAACGGGQQAAGPVAANAVGASCSGVSNAKPTAKIETGSTVVLAKVGGVNVADEDSKSILAFDIDSKKQLSQTPVGARPGQLVMSPDGKLYATLRESDQLLALAATDAASPLTKLCSASTESDPVGLAMTPDAKMVLVTTTWGQTLDSFEVGQLALQKRVQLDREPRAVAVSDDGKNAYVAHAVGGDLSMIDLASTAAGATPASISLVGDRNGMMGMMGRKGGRRFKAKLAKTEGSPRNRNTACQSFALVKSSSLKDRVFIPQVQVDPGSLEERSVGYGDDDAPTESASIAVLDAKGGNIVKASLTVNQQAASMMRMKAMQTPGDVRLSCLLPRSAGVDEASRSLLVTCLGIDAVIAYDAASPNPTDAERKRWIVGSGPTGVAVHPEARLGVAWAQFDRTLAVFPLGKQQGIDEDELKVVRIAAKPVGDVDPQFALGRILFHAAGDSRIASDGRACASCHPDGRDDGITWATPEGPRRSIMLAGRLGDTAPYSWHGNETSLNEHVSKTFERLSGRGLRSIELDAMVSYITHMPAPKARKMDAQKTERGKAIFVSAQAGCATCHVGPSLSDGKVHDVKSKVAIDTQAEFNTPSLRLIGGSGPYFHDGRYQTLRELFRATDGTMGKTKHLSDADLDSLETYVRSL
jgi:DNA-binding beta-propeller fold protein YncE/mono/diheme cytochrome c family protein